MRPRYLSQTPAMPAFVDLRDACLDSPSVIRAARHPSPNACGFDHLFNNSSRHLHDLPLPSVRFRRRDAHDFNRRRCQPSHRAVPGKSHGGRADRSARSVVDDVARNAGSCLSISVAPVHPWKTSPPARTWPEDSWRWVCRAARWLTSGPQTVRSILSSMHWQRPEGFCSRSSRIWGRPDSGSP